MRKQCWNPSKDDLEERFPCGTRWIQWSIKARKVLTESIRLSALRSQISSRFLKRGVSTCPFDFPDLSSGVLKREECNLEDWRLEQGSLHSYPIFWQFDPISLKHIQKNLSERVWKLEREEIAHVIGEHFGSESANAGPETISHRLRKPKTINELEILSSGRWAQDPRIANCKSPCRKRLTNWRLMMY